MINKGAFALVVAVATVGWRQGRVDYRSALAAIFGFAATIGAITLFFVLHGAAADFFYINVVFPSTRYASTGRVPYAFYFFDVVWRSPMSVLGQVLPKAVAAGATGVLAVPIAALAALPVCALALASVRVYSRASPMGKRPGPALDRGGSPVDW